MCIQVEKAFREGTARQNAHSMFVSLALKLLEERVHVACKEIITLEKQVLVYLLCVASSLNEMTILLGGFSTDNHPTDQTSRRRRKGEA